MDALWSALQSEQPDMTFTSILTAWMAHTRDRVDVAAGTKEEKPVGLVRASGRCSVCERGNWDERRETLLLGGVERVQDRHQALPAR